MGDIDDLPSREEPPEGEKPETERRRTFDRAIPELLKRAVERAVETGVGKLSEGPDTLRHFVGDMKLPKEVLNYLYQQIDDTKTGLYRVVAKEIRDVLEHTQFADELTKVLTKLSFEIKTEIRFVPNDARPAEKPAAEDTDAEDSEEDEGAATEGQKGLPKPSVSAQVTVKDRGKETRRERRRREGT
ncbi:hypothetical protein [Polyangium sp. y55x31]|uniref:hypothetical protein n=1 Tax=Polyangium sp. y55x31 TaxID=3042688 RepID=UPI002482E482|nr:hypothetical protein [Polyangium sp. y55x31]MDI1479083.1 hypothetical protein [Polyangium sp. y55x31]